jgi:hypothetical protein
MADLNRPQLILEVAFSTANPLTVPASWTDLSAYLRTDELSIRRGRPDELSQASAGTMVVTLDNRDGRFDPENTTAPYYPNIVPMRRVRLRAMWSAVSYTLFTGYAQAWTPTYDPRTGGATTVLRCIDMMGALLSFIPLGDALVYDGPWGTTASDAGYFVSYLPSGGVDWGRRRVRVTAHAAGADLAASSVLVSGTNAATGLAHNETITVDVGAAHTSASPLVVDSSVTWSRITGIRINPSSDSTGQAEIRVESSPYPAGTTGAAATIILDAIGVAAGDREIAAGSLTSVPAWSPGGSATAHALLTRLAQAEQGVYFVSKEGKVTFFPRSWRFNLGTPGNVLSGTQIPYSNFRASYDEKFLYPVVRATRAGGTPQEARDAAAVTAYGPRTLDLGSSLLLDSDNQAYAYAEAMLYRYKAPKLRVEQIELMGELKPAANWPVLLSTDVGGYVQLQALPPGGVFLQKNIFIEQIQITITGNDWRFVWSTSPADADLITFWLLDDATWGVLDSTTRLAF